MQKKSVIERYWWIGVLLWFLTRNKTEKTTNNNTNNEFVMATKPQEPQPKVIVKEVEKPIYVDVEAIERADDIAVTVEELNAQTSAVKYAEPTKVLEPTPIEDIPIPQTGIVKPLSVGYKYKSFDLQEPLNVR